MLDKFYAASQNVTSNNLSAKSRFVYLQHAAANFQEVMRLTTGTRREFISGKTPIVFFKITENRTIPAIALMALLIIIFFSAFLILLFGLRRMEEDWVRLPALLYHIPKTAIRDFTLEIELQPGGTPSEGTPFLRDTIRRKSYFAYSSKLVYVISFIGVITPFFLSAILGLNQSYKL